MKDTLDSNFVTAVQHKMQEKKHNKKVKPHKTSHEPMQTLLSNHLVVNLNTSLPILLMQEDPIFGIPIKMLFKNLQEQLFPLST